MSDHRSFDKEGTVRCVGDRPLDSSAVTVLMAVVVVVLNHSCKVHQILHTYRIECQPEVGCAIVVDMVGHGEAASSHFSEYALDCHRAGHDSSFLSLVTCDLSGASVVESRALRVEVVLAWLEQIPL